MNIQSLTKEYDKLQKKYGAKELDSGDSLFFNHQDPNMVEWFDHMVKERRQNDDCRKEKKNW